MRLNTQFGNITTEEAYNSGEKLYIGVDSIYTKKNKTQLRPCTLIKNGKKEVFRYVFNNGQEIELTPDHRISTPTGWKEIGSLNVGDEIHIQKNEFEDCQLIPNFFAGRIYYYLNEYESSIIRITKKEIINSLIPILNKFNISFNIGKNNIKLSRNHPALKEILTTDNKDIDFLKGFLVSALSMKKIYRQQQVIYNSKNIVDTISDNILKLFGRQVKPIRHSKKKNDVTTYRICIDFSKNELEKLKVENIEQQSLNLDFSLYGWLLSDGWLTDSSGLLFHNNDDLALKLLPDKFKEITNTIGTLRKSFESDTSTCYSIACYNKEGVNKLKSILNLTSYLSKDISVPEIVFKTGFIEKSSFLTAVFGADGCISGKTISLSSISTKWLKDIQLLLLEFGVHSNINGPFTNTKNSTFYNLLIKQRDNYKFFRYIGFKLNTIKQNKLEYLLKNKKRYYSYEDLNVLKLTSFEPLGIQDVYDIEEPTTNTLIVNGIVIHNCLLGSINLTHFVMHPFGSSGPIDKRTINNPSFDWKKFKKVVRIFTRMLDNVVEINGLPLPKQREEIIYKRRHGMGFLGLGSALTMMKIKYGSEEAVNFTKEVSKVLAIESYKMGIELAKEKGPAPIFDQSSNIPKNREGIEDNLSMFVKSKYLEQFPLEIIKEIKEHGCRFTHATSIAPTGTISLSIGNNCCISKGTMVTTEKYGKIPIEDISIDMKIKTYDPDNDNYKFNVINFVGITRRDTEVFEIELENKTKLRLTYDHEVLTKNINTDKIEYIKVEEIAKNILDYEILIDEDTLTCSICNFKTISKQQLSAHIRHTHNINSVEYNFNMCNTCNKEMTIDDDFS